MKVKKIISLIAGITFIAAFAVCPAFAESDELYINVGNSTAQKEHGLISGTLDYLGSVVGVASKGTWETFDSVTALVPRCCEERIGYRPNIVMNRGSRWSRRYKR